MADFRFAPNQWETVLFCNDVSHWMGASLESALIVYSFVVGKAQILNSVNCSLKTQQISDKRILYLLMHPDLKWYLIYRYALFYWLRRRKPMEIPFFFSIQPIVMLDKQVWFSHKIGLQERSWLSHTKIWPTCCLKESVGTTSMIQYNALSIQKIE